ncbi:MAG: lytic transglycosylase domain-containing protein [Firmicutes bacterium]|nr:lytic transglycosylase domain-containing protein [Bacillota bacterium]
MKKKICLILIVISLLGFGAILNSYNNSQTKISLKPNNETISENDKKDISLNIKYEKKVKHISKEVKSNSESVKEKNDEIDINEDNRKIDFIIKEAKLTKKEAKYLLSECEEKNLNIYLILGLMKVESNFNPELVGTSGERGLGQIMDCTAKALAKNLNIEYDPDDLFDPKYNIHLFTTHLKYLKGYYKNDMHKTLTAYNRGQNGLEKYVASRDHRKYPARSIYSKRVLEYTTKYKNKYENEK